MIIYREQQTLERDLGIPIKTLYGISNNLEAHYRTVELPKKDGGIRTLSVPDSILKKVQRRITEVLLSQMPVSPYATAYRYGGSVVRNARPHLGQPMLLKLDIHHFYDSILYSTVKERVFPAVIYTEPLRVLLSILCYGQVGLPQGAPTSPTISNIILYDFDREVGRWCSDRKINYSRYCDDMSFSGAFDPKEVTEFVRRSLRAEGFFLNERKTVAIGQGQRQIVTGVVVNEKLNASAEYRRKLRQSLYFCKKFGVDAHMEHAGIQDSPDHYLSRLLGQVNYVLSITPQNQEFLGYKTWILNEQKILI